MKKWLQWFIVVGMVALLLLPQTAFAQDNDRDKFVFGGNYTLAAGETLNGNLYVFGGNAALEEGSTVTGNVVILGGNLQANGQVNGDVLGFGGLITLGPMAVVAGDVTVTEGNLQREDGSQVQGNVDRDADVPLPIPDQDTSPRPEVNVHLNPVLDGIWFMFRAFLWAALAVLVVMFVPVPTHRVAQAVFTQPLIAGGVGLLTLIVLPLVLVVMAITILLIPASLMGFMALAVAWAYGMIAIGSEIGRRLAEQMHQEWAPPVQAALGTFGLVAVVNGIGQVVPCIGWIVPVVVGAAGIGAVFLTQAGTKFYPPVDPLAAPPMTQ